MANAMKGRDDLPEAQMDRFESETDFVIAYDEEHDILSLLRASVAKLPAVSLDVNGEFWLRMDPDTGEVFGVEIEDFEAYFVKQHPEVAQSWDEVHLQMRGKLSTPEPSPVTTLARRLGELITLNPAQMRFA